MTFVFIKDVIKELAYELFHEYRQVNDQQMKDRLKEKLENDERTAKSLQKLPRRGVSFDYLWDNRIHSQVSSIYIIYYSFIAKFITCLSYLI